MTLLALWTWIDIEIKKMQPYIDLVHGDSPPQRSLLLDYTRTKCVAFILLSCSCLIMNYISNFFVWISAFWNQHYMVAIATLLVLLGLVFQPLAAAMFTVRDTFLAPPSQFFVR
jgi:hypothetical protein